MMLPSLMTLLTLSSMASAAPSVMPRIAVTHSVLIGVPGQILTADLTETSFKITNKVSTGAGSDYSWMRYKNSTDTVYAVNEYGSEVTAFKLDHLDVKDGNSATGSAGVVFLEFNKDQTRMVGAGYGSSMLDVWDTSAAGAPKFLKSVNVTESYPSSGPLGNKPHQALFDPTGDWLVVPDLGADRLLIADAKADSYKIINTISLKAGSGPRHGGFIKSDNRSYYVVACELSNQVHLYEFKYGDNGPEFVHLAEQSTYGPDIKPKNATSAAAGALLVASNNRDVYISNRLSGDVQDNIAHFIFDTKTTNLTFAGSVPTGGVNPRSISFDASESIVFVTNVAGPLGVTAISRCAASGHLGAKPFAGMNLTDLLPDGADPATVGPQFVAAI
ncbi:Lactonase, 7-bladed beta-propeller-domain-containing protein [Xylaria flabelliformis]|nr:Lactonase, 7-bladed beta-propeller-domain-containing protein [Xylaria flabelliformis]